MERMRSEPEKAAEEKSADLDRKRAMSLRPGRTPWRSGPETDCSCGRILNAWRYRAPVSSLFSSSSRAALSASPWERPSCGRRASVSSVPVCLQSWWCLPMDPSFARISSGFPANRAGIHLRITGITLGRKRFGPSGGRIHPREMRRRGGMAISSSTALSRGNEAIPAYNGIRQDR
jgi:hypothetical protein